MKKKASYKMTAFLCATAAPLLILIIWTMWGNTALTVSTVTVSDDRIPASFSGFRIAQMSDLHNAEFGENNAVLLRLLADSAPDIIAVTGDLVDSRHTDVDVALSFVKDAVGIAPVYYVSGNHESRLPNYAELKADLEAAGAVVLEDEAVSLWRGEEKITLAGLSDPDFTVKGDVFDEVPDMVSAKLNSLADDEKDYFILLSHRPELFETYVRSGANLVLSGHAHGGQFRLPFIGGLFAPGQGFFPRYDGGLYTDGSTNMVVSHGIGNSIMPIRFNNRPEIVLVELDSTN